MHRIAVVGATGSGKTTLAKMLSERLGIPHVETDAIYWGKNWTPISIEIFRQRMDAATQGDRWVIDGNYSKVRDLVWGRADTLVWLDYPFWLVLWRLLGRTVPRVFSGEELWNGNRETLGAAFFSRDSLFAWLLQSYPRQKRTYPLIVQQLEYAHLEFIRLKSPAQANRWLLKLSSAPCEYGSSYDF